MTKTSGVRGVSESIPIASTCELVTDLDLGIIRMEGVDTCARNCSTSRQSCWTKPACSPMSIERQRSINIWNADALVSAGRAEWTTPPG